jgi:hypothetical protein
LQSKIQNPLEKSYEGNIETPNTNTWLFTFLASRRHPYQINNPCTKQQVPLNIRQRVFYTYFRVWDMFIIKDPIVAWNIEQQLKSCSFTLICVLSINLDGLMFKHPYSFLLTSHCILPFKSWWNNPFLMK